jgi:hypothetical protein
MLLPVELLELADIVELETDPFSALSLPPLLPTLALSESLSALTLSSSFII